MVEVPLWQSRFVVPGAAVELFLAELEDVALSVAAFEEPRIELMHRGEPDKEQLAACLVPLAERAGLERIDLTVAPLATTNWLARVAASFTPQRIGRFWVHGSHIREAAPAGAAPIRLDAGLAFGSGEHASTRGCLLALDELARRRRFGRVLDMGCGSGILAIAAAKCWPARVVAVDNDRRRAHPRALQRGLPQPPGAQVWPVRSDLRQYPRRSFMRHGARSRPPPRAGRHRDPVRPVRPAGGARDRRPSCGRLAAASLHPARDLDDADAGCPAPLRWRHAAHPLP